MAPEISQGNTDNTTAVQFDSMEMVGLSPGALSSETISLHSDRNFQGIRQQQAEEWWPLLLDESGTIEQEMIPDQLYWQDGLDLNFFPSFYYSVVE